MAARYVGFRRSRHPRRLVAAQLQAAFLLTVFCGPSERFSSLFGTSDLTRESRRAFARPRLGTADHAAEGAWQYRLGFPPYWLPAPGVSEHFRPLLSILLRVYFSKTIPRVRPGSKGDETRAVEGGTGPEGTRRFVPAVRSPLRPGPDRRTKRGRSARGQAAGSYSSCPAVRGRGRLSYSAGSSDR